MRIVLLTIAALLAACSDDHRQRPATPEPPIQFQRASVDDLAHGERMARVLGCIGCHGEDLTGEDWSEPGFGRMWSSNLTRAAARYGGAQLAAVIRSGARPDGSPLWEMPSHLFTQLTDQDMASLVAFLRSRPPAGAAHPAPLFEAGARREIAAGTFRSSVVHVAEQGRRWPPDAGSDHQLGRYIVRATCAECHRMDLGGGQPPAGQRRPDLRAVISAYDEPAFARLLSTGKAVGDREVGLMSEVARGRYAHLTTEERTAVFRYLRALPDP